ncbi:MAG: sigma 54-interacting transcriptional regulator [Deltaproteobacteria bacterium]|nr:sigma 54-interacting transcriptional regulator [Deltaproteobacteria bacterium]
MAEPPEYPYQSIPPELLHALLENPHESQILVDADGIIRFLSVHSEEFYETPPKAVIGKHISALNPDSQLPRVLQTGKAEIGRVLKMGGRERIVARIPLKDGEGRVVGAVGKLMFWHFKQFKELVRQIEVLENRLDYYEKELQQVYSNRYALERVVGESPDMQEAKRVAVQAAATDLAVLITGETGTGKEVFAHAIHQMSSRRRGPFVKVNCAAIPQDLFESELFGYEAGAFTGASHKGKPGKFELADGGTIFLDEVGDLPRPLQVKLLRVIQEQEVERLGGNRTLRLDFRVIAATNRDLKDLMTRQAFRQDLYYRLNIFHLETPALRTIAQDIPRIAYHLLSQMQRERSAPAPRIDPAAMARLTAHQWPGNVRELQNVLARAAAAAGPGPILAAHLPLDFLEDRPAGAAPPGQPQPLKQEMALAERRVIERALRFTGGNRAQAARLLGIHRTGLYQKLRAYGLTGRSENVD